MNPLVILIVLVAMFTQTTVGFGSALIAMPFLIVILGPDVARPAFMLAAYTGGVTLMWQYRKDWQLPDVKFVIVGTLVGIPVGTWVAGSMDKDMFMLVLGIIIICYSLYALSGFKLKEIRREWGTVFGFCSGILHSAYNVGGPPLVMYNSAHNWEARRFKGNTQATFFIMGMFVIFEHFRTGNITPVVLQNVALMLPAMFVGIFIGLRVEKYIKQSVFRKIVMVLLLIIGLNLVNPF